MGELLFKDIKSQRNYGIDLLRLLSMFMVVVLHVLGQGGILENTQALSVKGEIFWFLEIFCYCAVNVFAIISGVVGFKAKHKLSNLINLCIQLVFYAVIITIVDVIVLQLNDKEISLKNVILHLFPSIRSMWYFSAYFCLFFFMPLLNSVIEHTPRKVLKTSAVFVFVVFCCFGQISTKVANLNGGYSVLWLAILYLIGAYITKYELLNKLSPMKYFLYFLCCVVLTSISRIVVGNVSRMIFGVEMGIGVLISYTSPTILFSAIFLIVSN